MEVKWLVEDFEGGGVLDPLIGEIRTQGMKCEVVTYIPFQSGKYDNYFDEDCVIFYGSLNLASQIQRTKPWVPGPICNFKNLCCLTYYSHWGQYLLNQNYFMLPILELSRRREEIYKQFGIDDCIFMRPDSGAKTFCGNIYPLGELDSELKLMSGHAGKPMDEILAVVSSPKVISKEYRIVIIDKKAVAFSQYMRDGKLEIREGADEEAIVLANKIASSDWQPNTAYTLDICKSEGKYYLLEINSFSCSGLYECSVEPVVREASRVAMEEYNSYKDI